MSKLLLFYHNQLLVKKITDGYDLPTASSNLNFDVVRYHYLGHYHHHACYTASINDKSNLSEYDDWLPLRSALQILDQTWFTIIAKAYQIIQWDHQHQFCGRCGQPTQMQLKHFERYCQACHLSFFPKITPAIIVLIRKQQQILLTQQRNGHYGLIAGFVEPGETLETALQREVQEEVNLAVNNIRYMGSQSWPFPNNLMIAFTADYQSGDIKLNDHELMAADWYTKTDLPLLSMTSISIAKQLIDHFLQS